MSLIRSFVRQIRSADLSGFGVAAAEIPGPGEQPGWITWAGVPVTEMRALQQITVWACASLVTETIAQLPIGAYRGVGPTRQPLPDPQLIRTPADRMTWNEWMGQEMISAVLRGNAYGRIVARDDRLGYPTQIEPVHPDEIEPVRPPGGSLVYRLAGGKLLDPFEVFHVKGLTLPGRRSIKGLSPIEHAAQTIGLALGAEEYGARWFSESAVPPGYLSSDGNVPDDKAKEMQDRWVATHGNRSRKPAVLGGGLKWETITVAPEASQFLETRKATRSEICGFFRVPPHLVADVERSTSWGSGLEEQNLMWITVGLGTWIIRFEQAISAVMPRGQYVKFNLGQLLRARLLDQANAFKIYREIGLMNIDEERALIEMPPLPDGKGTDHTQPLNWGSVPSSSATNEPGQPPPDVTGG